MFINLDNGFGVLRAWCRGGQIDRGVLNGHVPGAREKTAYSAAVGRRALKLVLDGLTDGVLLANLLRAGFPTT